MKMSLCDYNKESEEAHHEHKNVVFLPNGRILKFLDVGELLEIDITNALASYVRIGETNAFPLTYEAGECEDGRHYLVMENVGRSLEDYFEHHDPLPITLYEVIDQVNSAIEFLNKVGIEHGDLHSGNIAVTNDGVVKIIDFGMASYRDYPSDNDVKFVIGSISQTADAATILAHPLFRWRRDALSTNTNITLEIVKFIDTQAPNAEEEWYGSYIGDSRDYDEEAQRIFEYLGLDKYGEEL